ncbi:hypothetical protein ACET3Z_000862 [Daucus carota]
MEPRTQHTKILICKLTRLQFRMELNKFESIKKLNTERFDWKCRLRLQSMWKGLNRETKEFWGINMTLIDDSNHRIHGFASSKYCKGLFEQLKEGNIYILTNFKVKDYVGDETYRPVRNRKHIYFTTHTKIETDSGVGLKIEKFAVDLFYMGEIKKLAEDNRFLIGRIQNVRTNIKSIKNDVEKVITKFDLTDGRYTVPVTLFDDFGVQFAEELEDCKQTEIYIIIAAAKVGLYEGIANLTNYPATRIYINPTHYSIGELKAKMLETIEETVSSPPQEITELKTLTIKEIKAMTPDSTECRVKCQLKVTKVEEQSSWFYAVCTKCPKEISRVDGVFKCEDCNRIIPYPDKRFRICTLCSDNTGSIAVIFLDQEVTRIIEKTVFDIEVDAIQENTEEKFPAVLKTFEKKVYTITLNITENNLKKGSMVYEADEIFDKIESSANFDPSTNTDTQMVEAATVDLKDDDLSTPTTGISSTKTRARVDIEPVAFDPKEDTPAKLNKKDKKKKLLPTTSVFNLAQE